MTGTRRLLLVHAHPDDESISTGATIARYAAEGAQVTLVTCTRGERGEVIPPALAALEGDGPALAAHRTGELAEAVRALGVTEHLFLGADAGVRYQDSGMAWGAGGQAVAAPDTGPEAFARADVDAAARHLARVLRQVRPQVVVGYEPDGGYGHPDHVQAHRVTMRAVDLAAAPGDAGAPWQVAKVYEVVEPESVVRETLRRTRPVNPFTAPDPDGPLPSVVVPDAEVTTVVVADDYLPAKTQALRAHATQVALADGFFALSNGVGRPLTGTEWFRLVRGVAAPDPARPDGRESDLFAGTEVPPPSVTGLGRTGDAGV